MSAELRQLILVVVGLRDDQRIREVSKPLIEHARGHPLTPREERSLADRPARSSKLPARPSDRSIEHRGEFVRRRMEAGEAGFVKMWEEMGGVARFDRRRQWRSLNRRSFEWALQQH